MCLCVCVVEGAGGRVRSGATRHQPCWHLFSIQITFINYRERGREAAWGVHRLDLLQDDAFEEEDHEEHSFPSFEYSLVNKLMTPSRILHMPPDFDVARRLLLEVMFKTTRTSQMSGELLSAIHGLETTAGVDIASTSCRQLPLAALASTPSAFKNTHTHKLTHSTHSTPLVGLLVPLLVPSLLSEIGAMHAYQSPCVRAGFGFRAL